MISVGIYCKSKGGGKGVFCFAFLLLKSYASGRRKEYYKSLMTSIEKT